MAWKKIKWFWHFLGIFLFVFILFRLNLDELRLIFSQIRLPLFLTAIPLFFLIMLTKNLCWQEILFLQGIEAPLRDLYPVYMASFYLGAVTPGRAGELIKYVYIRRKGYDLGVSLFGVIFDKLLDVIFVFMVGYVGMFFFASFLRSEIIYVSSILAVSICMLIFFWWKGDLIKKIYFYFLNFLIPEKFRDKSHLIAKQLLNEFKKGGLRYFALPLFFTFLSWLFYYCQVYLLAHSLGIKVGFFYLSVFVSIAALVALLPITFQGIGTREAVLIFFFGILGLPAEKAVALSLSMLLLFSIHALIGLFYWFNNPLLREES